MGRRGMMGRNLFIEKQILLNKPVIIVKKEE
jgi:hypothetical protein